MNSGIRANGSPEFQQRRIKLLRYMILCLAFYLLIPISILQSDQWKDNQDIVIYVVYPFVILYCVVEIVFNYLFTLYKMSTQVFCRACWERVLDFILNTGGANWDILSHFFRRKLDSPSQFDKSVL